MDGDHNNQDNFIIRISKEEAYSSHVDDLLNRQKNLRGDKNSIRHSRGHWYMQNWFIFMIFGALAAFSAWIILEPYFDDYTYFQGKIDRISYFNEIGEYFHKTSMTEDADEYYSNYMVIRGEKVLISDNLQEAKSDGTFEFISIDKLHSGQNVGIYISSVPIDYNMIHVAEIIKFDPPAQSPDESRMKISQLIARSNAASMLLFPVLASFVGFAIGAINGIVCRQVKKALIGGMAGLLIGFIGTFFSNIIAGLVYSPLNSLAIEQFDEAATYSITPFGFFIQMTGRALAWSLAGMTMGLGQGIALQSKRLLLYGFLGGILGGLIGGLLFDPIDLILMGGNYLSTHWSRMIGLTVIGLTIGLMIGVVELMAKDAWLQMTKGPLSGKEFLLFKDTMRIGSSARNEIYLFNDKNVAENHALIRMNGDLCEIQNLDNNHPALLNGTPAINSRLRDGDKIAIGNTEFIFQSRKDR